MPIVTNLDVVLAKRKMTLTELSRRVDITIANLSNLKKGKARAVRFSTLVALCRELDCQPADILEYRFDNSGKLPSERISLVDYLRKQSQVHSKNQHK